MSDLLVLKAEARTEKGKKIAKRLRFEGKLPAVVYGEQDDSIPCAVDRKVFETLLHAHGRNAIISLDTGGKTPAKSRAKPGLSFGKSQKDGACDND